MKLSEILNQYIETQHISIREFARRTGLANSYVANLVNGTNANPTLDAIAKISKAMNVTKNELFDALDDNQMFTIKPAIQVPPIPYQIPLYSSISCGFGMFIDDCVEDYIAVPDRYIHKGHEYFANTACGDSMIGAGIHDGDVLVFERTPTVENGEIGVFCIDNNDAVCKTFRRLSNGLIMLESSNPKYDPIMIDCTNECFRTIGKLIGSFRKF